MEQETRIAVVGIIVEDKEAREKFYLQAWTVTERSRYTIWN